MPGARLWLLLSLPLLAPGCGDSAEGIVAFTTQGDASILQSIPAGGEAGFTDGWGVTYTKFLVSFAGVTVADAGGSATATMHTSRLVDNARKASTSLVIFPGLEDRTYAQISYQIVPVTAATVPSAADVADRDFMAQYGFSLYVEGNATKGTLGKTFKWGFAQAVSHTGCRSADGSPGITVTGGGATDVIELTTRGRSLFFDRLTPDPTGQLPTHLRFDAIAAADADGNNDVTLDELSRAPLDPTTHDAGDPPAGTLGELVTRLSRTVGGFRGEGACTTD